VETKPSFSEFSRFAERGNLIPVYREILGDLETPVSAYLKVRDASFSYLLESADGGERWGRYSFIGYRPHLSVRYGDGRLEISDGPRCEVRTDVVNPLPALRDISRRYTPVSLGGLPPFQGGLVGYVNYDLARAWERLPGLGPAEGDFPECLFTSCERLIIFDHLTHQIKVVAFARIEEGADPMAAYGRACDQVEETVAELDRPLPAARGEHCSVTSLASNFAQERFEEAVVRSKEYIAAGDVIQVVLSQCFTGEAAGDDFALYRALRSVNPSPYMFYLNFGEVRLIGASPEVLVRLTDGTIHLRPIAGTRRRGESQEEDEGLERELMADPKERAEHVMLVDLGRNDVGRVAAPGSVRVPRLMEVERYSHVMHIVSSVEGDLRKGLDAFDVFMASFPAGTVSGAPKIRAMEIINELEPSPRGPYAGAVGYFGFNGNMDFCITIRTITVQGNRLSIQVGAGIVADSSPQAEHEETMRKAAAMFKAIERVKDHGARHR
jgi:anthranilate synthase component 1